MNCVLLQGRIDDILNRGRAGNGQVRRNVVAVEVHGDAVRRKGRPRSSDRETQSVRILEGLRSIRVKLAQCWQIDLAGDEHKKVWQQVAPAGDTQSRFAVERDRGVVAIGVLQKHILKSAPTEA